MDCNDRVKHDRITDEINSAINALRLTQRELELDNYYYKNFVPSEDQEDLIDDFKYNIYEKLINLAEDLETELRWYNPSMQRRRS